MRIDDKVIDTLILQKTMKSEDAPPEFGQQIDQKEQRALDEAFNKVSTRHLRLYNEKMNMFK